MNETEVRVRHSSQRHQSPARRFLRTYRFEIFWLGAVLVGLFLLVEQLNIRKSLAAWIRRSAAGLSGGLQQLGLKSNSLLARLSLSDAIGLLLLAGAVVAVVLRLRWRLLNNPSLAAISCPRCGGPIHRVHRNALDRLICLYVPVRRYRCHDSSCRWRGLRVGKHQSSGRPARPSA